MYAKHYEAGSEFPPLQKGKLRLYSMKFCPYADRTKLVLAVKNIPYEVININLVKKPEWFLARTPTGTVPVLELEDGRIIYESLIVSEYLDSLSPQYRLIPTDPFEKAKHQILIETNSRVVTGFYKVLRKVDGGENELNNALEFFEKALIGAYFGGENAGFTDYMIWPWYARMYLLKEFANYDFDVKKFSKLSAWIERMKELDEVKQIVIKPEENVKFYAGYLAGSPVYDD